MEIITQKQGQILTDRAFRRLVNNVTEILYSLSFTTSLRMDFINTRAEELTGYPAKDLLAEGTGWFDIVHPDDRVKYVRSFKHCKRTGRAFEMEYRVCKNDGTVCEVQDKGRPVFDEAGHIIGVDGSIIDVTERMRLQRKLERTQMIRNIGRLAAGIAHEINAPIQFIGDNMRFLSDSFKRMTSLLELYKQFEESVDNETSLSGRAEKIKTAEQQADLEFICREIPQAIEQNLDGIERVSTIVSAVRDFSHRDERRMAPADLNRALKTSIVILRGELKHIADVKMELDDNLPMVNCCVDDMYQVFLNLLINAEHSIAEALDDSGEKKGLITVRTTRQDPEVVISISDTGTGICPDIEHKVFDLFFTTKEPGKGTGQGLSFARSIVTDKHNGRLDFETKIGVGTTFNIYLPIERNTPQKR